MYFQTENRFDAYKSFEIIIILLVKCNKSIEIRCKQWKKVFLLRRHSEIEYNQIV